MFTPRPTPGFVWNKLPVDKGHLLYYLHRKEMYKWKVGMTYKSVKKLEDQAAKVDLVVQWLPLLPLLVAVIHPFEPLFPPSYYPSRTIFYSSLALLPPLTFFHLLVPIPLLFPSFQSRVSRHVGHYLVVKSMDRLRYNLDRLPRVSLVSVLLV